MPFAGWRMPVQYTGVIAEHLATRSGCGIFDVSHMGQIETRGPQAERFLQRLLSNDVSKLAVGAAQYSLLCREDGGVLDDVFTYRLGPSWYLTVTNASNHEKDLGWFQEQGELFEVHVRDVADVHAMVAVQGPDARRIVEQLSRSALPMRFHTERVTVAGSPALVCGTGYTGEDGVEILCAPETAPALWDALIAGGATPVGLAARDTLRLEVCYHLYGNDLMATRGPIEAGLGWACKEDTGFIGSEAVRASRSKGPQEKLMPFVMEEGIARQGNIVLCGGEVTSGTLSPSLEIAIGLAYLPVGFASEGTPLEIDVRGRVKSAHVVARPFYGNGV